MTSSSYVIDLESFIFKTCYKPTKFLFRRLFHDTLRDTRRGPQKAGPSRPWVSEDQKLQEHHKTFQNRANPKSEQK